MENVFIRQCTPKDIEAVLHLDEQWEQEDIAYDFIPISQEEFAANLARFPAYFLVAESEGDIVGYVNGTVHRGTRVAVIPEQEPYVEIENVYVKPGFRNSHIGGKLVERLLEVAEQNGIQRCVVTSVSKDMDKVLNFYRGHGFKLWQVQLFK
jgi:ribosomal protein S18 acetylase RimI-like enzyme